MTQEDKKLDRLLTILKKSKPALGGTDDLAENVISRIRHASEKNKRSTNLFDYIFGWVYIGWIRTSLVAASIIIIVLFAYQQSIILKRINALNQQAIITESQMTSGSYDNHEVKLLLNKLQSHKIRSGQNSLTDKKIDELIESINDIKVRYKDLMKIIEDDPYLKKEIEKKLKEKNLRKFNL